MTTEYLIAFRDGTMDGCAERASNRDAALSRIEEFVQDYGCELEFVQEIECSDGWYCSQFVTDEILECLHRRETERYLEKFLEEEHSFRSFTGYLESQDRNFPPAKLRAAG